MYQNNSILAIPAIFAIASTLIIFTQVLEKRIWPIAQKETAITSQKVKPIGAASFLLNRF